MMTSITQTCTTDSRSALQRPTAAVGRIIAVAVCAALLWGCGAAEGTGSGTAALLTALSPSSPTRSFAMGYTTWPFAVTARTSGISAQQFVFDRVKEHWYCDLGALHFMDGVPWEAGNDAYYAPQDLDAVNAYSGYYRGDAKTPLAERIAATAPQRTLYLAIDSLNGDRSGLAPRFNSGDPSFVPGDGSANTDFHTDQIHYAYTNYAIYALWLVYRHYSDNGYPLPTVYFNLGTEASDLAIGGSFTGWNNFEVFTKRCSQRLKSYSHDDSSFQAFVRGTKLLISIVLRSPGSAAMTNLKNAMADSDNTAGITIITDYLDLVGISTYGYLFYDDQWGGVDSGPSGLGNDRYFVDDRRGNPAELPPDWLSQVTDIAPGMAYGITETGWIGEDLLRPAMADLNAAGGADDYLVSATEENQNAYVQMALAEADRLRCRFVIFFSLADYDCGSDYYLNTGRSQDFLNLYNAWVKTGLLDTRPTMDTDAEYRAITGDLMDGLRPRAAWSTWQSWFQRRPVQ